MLDDALKAQLPQSLGMLRQPIRLIASLDDSETGNDMRQLLDTIASLSDKVSLDTTGTDARKPSFVVARENETQGVRFAGLPLGHEFTSLVLALLWTGGHPPKVEQNVIDSIKTLDGDFNFEVYMSLTCHNCPDVVQALSLMAIVNPKVKTVVIEGGAFQKEVEERQIMAVPMVFLNGQVFGSGRMSAEEIVAKLDTGAAARDAAKLSEKDPFDVLIVGGGPAGAAAAVYGARKGMRVGVAAERFGGEVNSWPSGKPAKRTPWASPARATTKDGLRASLPAVSKVTKSDKPAMVSSRLRMSLAVSLSSSEAIKRMGWRNMPRYC